MKNIFSFLVLAVLTVCVIFSQTANGQTPFQAPIWFSVEGTPTDTLHFGLDPLATNNVDSLVLPVERELPPIPPSDVFDARFLNTPSGSTNFGEGIKYDLRGIVGLTQSDTFVVYFQVGVGSITLTWPDLKSVCGTLVMVNHPSYIPPDYPELNVNMLYQNTITFTTEYIPMAVKIIRTQAKPALAITPSSWDYGMVFIGAPATKAFTFDNTTGTADVVVSSLTSPDPKYTLDKVAPWTIPAGASDVLNVTFTPVAPGTTSGDISIVHNSGDWSDVIPVTATAGDPGMYRSFTDAELVTKDPLKGKLYKPIKRKATSVEEIINLPAIAGKTDLHIEFGGSCYSLDTLKKNDVAMVIPTDYTVTGAVDGKNKKFDFVFATPLSGGDIITIHGYAKGSKPLKFKYYWTPLVKGDLKYTLVPTDTKFELNMPRLPMPNYGNVAYDIFPGVKAGGSGILLGTNTGDPKLTGWLKLYDAKSMLATFYDTKLHTGTARNFDFLKLTKLFVKEQKKLPPAVHDNILVAKLIALKFNIIASMQENTPKGFGELKLYMPGNPLHDMTLSEIYDLASPKMTTVDPGFDYVNCASVVAAVNAAFSGAIDTSVFGTKLVLTGTKTLSEVTFLRKGTLVAKTSPAPAPYQMPETYSLAQNYPNPFNPTTTIEFNLPEDAIVTLKVYNTLGQEVATLLDREEVSAGEDYATFDASSLSSGVYFYRLIAQEVETGVTTQMIKKMVLMK
jgi:hypothetical protein